MFALPIYAKTAGRWLSRGLTLVVFAVASGSLWPLARAPDTSTAPSSSPVPDSNSFLQCLSFSLSLSLLTPLPGS